MSGWGRICVFAAGIFLWATIAGAQFYGTVDRRAENAPDSVTETPEKLVSYLTENVTNPAEKARAIAVWIAFYVQRDGYRRKVLIRASDKNRLATQPVQNDVFRTRIGTPQEFAALFQQLATLAGLESVVIDGFAGHNISAFRYQEPIYAAAEVVMNRYLNNMNYPLQRYRAAWNAVKIEDEWHLLDTYWMIGGTKLYTGQTIDSDREMERFLEKRMRRLPSRADLTRGKSLDSDYFFASPRRFVKTHFPLDSNWQLLPVPVSWSSFTN